MKTNLFEQTREALERMGMKFQADAEVQCFRLGCQSNNSQWLMILSCQEDDDQGFLCAVSHVPMPVPAAKRGSVARLLHALNHHIQFGALLFDDDDGQISFRASTWVAIGGELDFTLQHLVASNWTVMDAACAPLMGFLFGKLTAKEALEKICSPADHEPEQPPAPSAGRFPDRWQFN